MSLSRKELEDLKPVVEKTVAKFLGFAEPTLAIAALNCITKGYEKRKTIQKLSPLLEEQQVQKFAEKLYNAYDDFRTVGRRMSRKRKDEGDMGDIGDVIKKARAVSEMVMPLPPPPPPVVNNTNTVPEPANPSPGQLTADKIKDMMANAQRMIQERKNELLAAGAKLPPVPMMPAAPTSVAQLHMDDAYVKAKRAADLKARIQSQLMNAGIAANAAATIPGMNAIPPGIRLPSKPTPLILDEQGRTIDAKTGQAVELKQHQPTLKANIRAKRREQFKAVHDKPPEEISETKYFDARVSIRGAQRLRRSFKFHEEGKFEQLAIRLRTKAQLDKLQNEIAQAAKKTGIASATMLATILPKKQLKDGEIPNLEWWDSVILKEDSYDTANKSCLEKYEGITHLIEHPSQMKPPAEPTKPVEINVMLTAKERKKLRRQNRGETQKELTEKIRLGLMPPPEPKVRMANLMRVLGTEAVQDPTKVEQHVREQMAKRQRGHEEANAARKLTKEQRQDKKASKLKEDTSLGVLVAVYRVRSLHNPSHKFKVETNAKQLYMTGLVVMHKECNVIVVEGGPKQQKKFRRLMLTRIKWHEDRSRTVKKDEDAGSDEEEKKENSCQLVWDGQVKQRAFGEIRFKACPTESFAREQFNKQAVEHYWDLAYSAYVLENTDDVL